MASDDWTSFLVRSQKKKNLLSDIRKNVVEEFLHLLEIFGHNERPTLLAIKICEEHPDSNVAIVLNDYVERLS
ncbi:MAG TPA: hypothetical protein DDY52_03515 [Candidatus Moranbacteria bacterium]|nr:MAG: hypothetical protein UR51_C0010G0038 [Candidatus Moranbacteria bacterium GW2011_GWF1_34_10]HBI17190.1 hypothetical protein [Candidatus Moranbacteria bacterium]